MWFRELSGKCCSISFLTINPSSSRLASTNVSFALLSLCCYHSRWHRYAPKSCQAATDRQSTWTPVIWRVPVFRDHSRGQPWMCSITVPAAANANSSGNSAALSVVLAAVFIRTKDSDGGGEGRGGEMEPDHHFNHPHVTDHSITCSLTMAKMKYGVCC